MLELAYAGDNDRHEQAVEESDEGQKEAVIVSSHTGAQPDTVMVELAHAVVANVAVS